MDTFITQQLVTDQAQLADLPSDVTFVPFPMGAHKVDLFVTLLQNILGLFFTIIFTWPFSRLVRNLVDEKERRIREGAKMMGMRDSAFFMSWFFTYAIMLTIAAVLSVAISKSMVTMAYLFGDVLAWARAARALLATCPPRVDVTDVMWCHVVCPASCSPAQTCLWSSSSS